MWTSKNKKIYLILSIIFIIGILIGILFLTYLDEASKEIIYLNINEYLKSDFKINNIFIHLVILSTLFISNIFIIGLPLCIFILFYSGFSIGFSLICLYNIFGIKGILYGSLYNLISKGFYIVFIFIFINTLIKLVKEEIDIFTHHKKEKEYLRILFIKSILCILIILFIDIILYFSGNFFINCFNFLLN